MDDNKKLSKILVTINTHALLKTFKDYMRYKGYKKMYAIKNQSGKFATETLDNPSSLHLIRYTAVFPKKEFATMYLQEKTGSSDLEDIEIVELYSIDDMYGIEQFTSIILCEYI